MAMAIAMKGSLNVSDRLMPLKHAVAGDSWGLKVPQSFQGCKRTRKRRCIVLVAAPAIEPIQQNILKRAVAKRAMELVKPGMVIGLGTGSTASMAIEELGKLVQQGKLKDVIGVGTNYQSRILARQFGVKTVDLNDVNRIDIAFDGADEVDSSMNVLKGGGAAHTMGKVVDTMTKSCVILVDQSKVVSELGLTFPVPVEVIPQAISPVLRQLVTLGGVPEIRNALRKDGPVITDLGNMVVDVSFPEGIKDPASLEQKINLIPGVVENGLLTGVATSVLVATQDGDDITVVELDEFVKSLRSVNEVHSET
uniref:ribose-5-phosphate isomerase n=1 Tax=Araucaria cunninghamii TaxID=56994 RepID=A0A0D6QX18_ARACU